MLWQRFFDVLPSGAGKGMATTEEVNSAVRTLHCDMYKGNVGKAGMYVFGCVGWLGRGEGG